MLAWAVPSAKSETPASAVAALVQRREAGRNPSPDERAAPGSVTEALGSPGQALDAAERHADAVADVVMRGGGIPSLARVPPIVARKLRIHGYASSEGDAAFNLALSCHRANIVADLVRAKRAERPDTRC